MSSVVIGLLCLLLFLVLMFLGLPIPFSMLMGGVVGLAVLTSPTAAAQFVVSDFITNFSSYTLTVGPMFGLMGFLANFSGIGGDLFSTINVFTRHRRGGLSIATQAACALFGAICGSTPATIATMSTIAYPEMKSRGYSPALAANSIASGAHLAGLIPPSTIFIIYGMATNASIGALFMSGIGPGILLMLLNIAATLWIVRRNPNAAPADKRSDREERLKALRNGNLWAVVLIFVIAMGGLFAGFFTPTEAGSVGALAMLIVVLVKRQLTFRKFLSSILSGIRLMAMVYILMSTAGVFGRMFTVAKIPTALGSLVNSMDIPGWAIMAVIIAIYFLLGMVTDLISMVLVTMPVFYPIIVTQLGYDPIWFGALIVLIVSTGMLTPPVGGSIFVTAGCLKWDSDVSIGKLFGGVWPFVIALLVCTVLLIIFPPIATFLPGLIYG